MKLLSLIQLKKGEKGSINKFEGGYRLVNKLNALGVRIGKQVTVISDSFIGGPVTVQIGNTTLSIGRGMAAKIVVEVKQ